MRVLYIFSNAPRTGSSWTEEAKLLASDGSSEDFFGGSVSISGDYVAIGAVGDDDNGNFSGSAYVFKRTGTNWAQEAKLMPSDGAERDLFGGSVSISGDYAIVGAWGNDGNGNRTGAAYVFKRSDTSWAQEARLVSSDIADFDGFGTSVSISGDYAAVSADSDDDNGFNSGSAYVFKRSDRSWVQEAKLLPSDGETNEQFGFSISISSDYVIVGSRLDDENGENSGSAYVFKRTGASWAQQAKLLPSDGAPGEQFGFMVSIYGDYSVVIAPEDDDNGSNAGSVYLFKRNDTSWTQEAKLLSSDGDAEESFGASSSISGNFVIAGVPVGEAGAFENIYRTRMKSIIPIQKSSYNRIIIRNSKRPPK